MSTHTTLRATIPVATAALAAAVFIVIFGISTEANAPAPLFAPKDAPASSSSAPSDIAENAIRYTTLTVPDKAIASGAILEAEAHVFNLFPDVRIVAMRNRVESRSARDYSWFGYIPGDRFGRAIVAVVSGKLSALVTNNGHRYIVLPLGGEEYEAAEIRQNSDREGNDIDTTTVRPGRTQFGMKGMATAPALDPGGFIQHINRNLVAANVTTPVFTEPDSGSVIDIIAVYTQAAWRPTDPLRMLLPIRETPYGLYGRLQLSIDEANQSFWEDGIPTRINLVAEPREDLYYVEAGYMADDRDAVTNGQVMNVHFLRDAYAADLVVFLTSGGVSRIDSAPLCGVAFINELGYDPEDADRGYLVVNSRCLGRKVTLAHEIGHHLGAGHDWYRTRIEGPAIVPSYAHGYILHAAGSPKAVQTIMSYPDFCNDNHIECHQVSRWSNPANLEYGGLPLGVPSPPPDPALDAADDERVLKENYVEVANYRRSACRAAGGC